MKRPDDQPDPALLPVAEAPPQDDLRRQIEQLRTYAMNWGGTEFGGLIERQKVTRHPCGLVRPTDPRRAGRIEAMINDLICLGCKALIRGRVVWLAEDYRDEGGEIEGPFPLHATCANAPWPLFEVTAAEAADLQRQKNEIANENTKSQALDIVPLSPAEKAPTR